MENSKVKNPVRIGLDANIIIYLSRVNRALNEADKKVVEALENGNLNAEDYQTTNFRDLPPMLRCEYIGELTTGVDGKDHYGYLEELYELLKCIKMGIVQPIIGPTVKFELRGNPYADAFADQYVTEVKIAEDDMAEFLQDRRNLAYRYANAYAIDLGPNSVELRDDITADACLTAEFSLFGVNFITANLRHLIHKNIRDFKRRDRIGEVNQEYGLNYSISHLDQTKYSPIPLTVAQFLMRLRNYLNRGVNAVMYFKDCNLDENNRYSTKSR